ncbi:MAG: His-Xaa-Ser system protein HxsD [Candidatus Gracilibacteria bacterium]|nr:His-Xaa-Ser system protein HxsD [Candidatus Gracilibacteria bacterium]
MENFLKEIIVGEKFELLIDKNLFSKDIVLKAAYGFLDLGYFFFKLDENENIIMQFTKKSGVKKEPKEIIGDFSDELLNVYLRDKLEHDNKEIREKIVGTAIANSIDSKGFVEFDTDKQNNDNKEQNQIDFDKDIDEILREIENDPELKIDEAEIERILKEIEEETQEMEIQKPTITLDPNTVKDVKAKFQNRK